MNTIAASSSTQENIHWYEGTVEAAFKESKKTNKPLFLYWGAVWCPPCNQIKKTIFNQTVFHNEVKNYIPVYLDGDEPRAQIWADKLKAYGYPTMLIYSPEGKEVMRLPTGLSAVQFSDLMKTSRKNLTPIAELLEKGLAGTASDAEWNLLSGFSWGQEYHMDLSSEQKVTNFKTLHENVPARLAVAKSRFFFHYLNEITGNESKIEDAEREALIQGLQKVLSSSELVYANLENLSWYPEDLAYLVPTKNGQRDQLQKLWLDALKKVEGDHSLSTDERMSSLYPLVYFFKMDNPKADYTVEVQNQVKSRCDWAEMAAKDKYDRQAAMSTAVYLLRKTQQLDDSKKVAIQTLANCVSPYYFMRSLATIAEMQGHPQEALGWLKSGWDQSTGHATRFEWATSYLAKLFKLAPDNTQLIHLTVTKTFKELLETEEDAFSGRKQSRLKRVKGYLQKWNKDQGRQEAFVALKGDLGNLCKRSDYRKECTTWVEAL